jgi:hypothetical protein
LSIDIALTCPNPPDAAYVAGRFRQRRNNKTPKLKSFGQ